MDFGPLITAVEKSGAPILGAALRAAAPISGVAPFPLNLILPPVLSGIADAIGGDPSDPTGMADKINADPNAAAKIQAVEDTHKDNLQSALDFAKEQAAQNAPPADLPFWAKVFFSFWRPAMGWIAGPIILSYQLIATTAGFKPVPGDMFNVTMSVWGGLAGLRTIDKWQGTASPMPVVKKLLRKK